jgi:phosphonopyruvate decarboxylase
VIEARQFVEAARAHGFDWYAGVPCSYLSPFINYVLQDPTLHYLSAANEGDAVALIAGITLGAGRQGSAEGARPGGRGVTMMQNSGLGNAVSPLTSLAWTFRLPQLLIVTWRGQPGVADEPQHALMGPITPAMLDTMEIPWETFPTEADGIGPALERALAHMDATGRPYALLMQKGSVAPYPLRERAERAARELAAPEPAPPASLDRALGAALPTRRDALERVLALTPASSTVVLASTGFCGRELYALDDRPNQLYMVGSMGCIALFALGVALARPDLKVVALDGDGAALMRMSAFATLGAYGPANLLHVLLDNGAHDSTGGQATVSPGLSFAGIAAACGYAYAAEGDSLQVLDALFQRVAKETDRLGTRRAGTAFARVSIRGGTPDGLPRPAMTPVEVKERFQRHLASQPGGPRPS